MLVHFFYTLGGWGQVMLRCGTVSLAERLSADFILDKEKHDNGYKTMEAARDRVFHQFMEELDNTEQTFGLGLKKL